MKSDLSKKLKTIRDKGWVVGIHNDYKLKGKFYTFWLFTHPNGNYVKGEAETDEKALDEVLTKLKAKK